MDFSSPFKTIKMKIYIFIFLSLFGLLFIQSCDKMIQIDLPNDQINTGKAFQDKRSTFAALSNLYTNLRESSFYSGKSQGIGTFLGLYTDELEDRNGPSSSPYADNYLIYTNSLSPERYSLETIWNTAYSHIYAINAFIQGVSQSSGIEEGDKIQLKGEAYVLRAMYYTVLTQIFGDIPYTISTDYRENTFIKKTKVIEVLNNIEQDLLQANAILTYDDRSPEKYYPNKAVVELLLAKNYLLQKKYDKAEFYARLVANNDTYHLEADLAKVFKKTAKSTIWQMSNSTPIAATYEARNYTMIVSYWMYRLSEYFVDSFETGDLRKSTWIKQYLTTDSYYAYKYKVTPTNNTDENSILFRVEEANFTLAEALIYQDREKEAIPYINTIRERAGLAPLPTTLSKEEAKLAMLEESRKEFFLEHGRRFFDLKRNKKLSLLKAEKPNWEDKHALLPLPEKETLINPNLLPNNEGY